MHGVQPRPKRKPSSGAAASPTAGTVWTRTSRCEERHQPGEGQAEQDREHAEHDLELSAPVDQPGADARRTAPPSSTKTTEKPSTNSSEPASIRPRSRRRRREVGAGQAGGVGEVARQQRDHARREERHQAGDQRHRDGEHQRARRRPARWNQSAIAAATCRDRPRPGRSAWSTGTRADDRWRRPGPRRRAPRCSGWSCGVSVPGKASSASPSG